MTNAAFSRNPFLALSGCAWATSAMAKTRHRWQGVALGADVALTLNGIAQGFAADRLAQVAARHGLDQVLIDAGEARALGTALWTARIEAPDGTIIRELALPDRRLATSAAFGTRVGPAGNRAHIIGPAGQDAFWSAVSISANSAALDDALSTAGVLMTRPLIDAALAAFPETRIEALHA